MKWLLLGGAYQGKLSCVLETRGMEEIQAGDCALLEPEQIPEYPIWYRLHSLIWKLLERGEHPQEWIVKALDQRTDWVVICDEVGFGVVPIDPLVRQWREAVGETCCALARQADCVDRITCGIPQRLKGDREQNRV